MGVLVCQGAKELLASADRLTESWKRTYQERLSLDALVRIAVIPGSHPILTRQILPRLRESYPHIRYKVLEIRDPMLLPYLAEDQVDLVLSGCLLEKRPHARTFAREQGLELVELCQDAYKIAVGAKRPLAKGEQLTAQQARALPLACYSGGDAAAQQYFERFFDREISVEYTSIEKMVQEAEQGPGVSVLPELTVGNTYPDTLRFLTVEGFLVPFVHFLAFRQGAGSRKELQVTVQAIQQVFSRELR
jgi:DNA-binding transcriptional LysR family regulator